MPLATIESSNLPNVALPLVRYVIWPIIAMIRREVEYAVNCTTSYIVLCTLCTHDFICVNGSIFNYRNACEWSHSLPKTPKMTTSEWTMTTGTSTRKSARWVTTSSSRSASWKRGMRRCSRATNPDISGSVKIGLSSVCVCVCFQIEIFFFGWAISRCLSTTPHPIGGQGVVYFLYITLWSYYWHT